MFPPATFQRLNPLVFISKIRHLGKRPDPEKRKISAEQMAAALSSCHDQFQFRNFHPEK